MYIWNELDLTWGDELLSVSRVQLVVCLNRVQNRTGLWDSHLEKATQTGRQLRRWDHDKAVHPLLFVFTLKSKVDQSMNFLYSRAGSYSCSTRTYIYIHSARTPSPLASISVLLVERSMVIHHSAGVPLVIKAEVVDYGFDYAMY